MFVYSCFYFASDQIQMIGYDISWAGFNIIEVMSSPKFTCKRVGYLSASQCFHADSEVKRFALASTADNHKHNVFVVTNADDQYDQEGS